MLGARPLSEKGPCRGGFWRGRQLLAKWSWPALPSFHGLGQYLFKFFVQFGTVLQLVGSETTIIILALCLMKNLKA
jgi:hypothetical protein